MAVAVGVGVVFDVCVLRALILDSDGSQQTWRGRERRLPSQKEGAKSSN